MSINRSNTQEIYDHLWNVIKSRRFLQKEGLGNEVPFFICPYHPEQATEIEQALIGLIKRLEQSGIMVLNVNLYDTSIKLLKERDVWDRILEVESTISKGELNELLRNVLDPERHLIPEIESQMKQAEPFDVLMLSGIGEVFPYIRSHTVLNNLQSKAKEQPTILFFPGRYTQSLETGASLDLFGRFQDDKYYRAFNILDYTI